MDIEHMQHTWQQMTTELNTQKKLTNTLILNMTQQTYTSKVNRILRTELVGTIICFMTVSYILYNRSKFESLPSQICAILLVFLLVTMPLGSIYLLKKLKQIDVRNASLKSNLIHYATYKKLNLRFQKFSIAIGFILLPIASAVFSVLFSNKDLFEGVSLTKIIVALIVGGSVFTIIAYLGNKYYRNALQDAQNTLEELQA